MPVGNLKQPQETDAALTAMPIQDVVALIVERASAVIGDRERALRWMGSPVKALGYATPISLLNSAPGEQAVLTVLGRLEHGVL